METSGTLSPAIVVTGASSGIGRDIARLAARDRCFLLLLGRSQAALDALATELAAAGAQVEALALDLLDPHAADQIERVLSDRGLYCDVLVNSAGFGVFGPAAKAAPGEQLNLVDVNIRALTELTLRFLPAMVARGRGGVLNVGSITGYVAGPNMAAYYASKAYVNSFSAALAAEVAGQRRDRHLPRSRCRQDRLFRALFGRAKPAHEADAALEFPAIAEAGWRGFKAGRRLVIPRLIDRISVAICILPQSLLTRFVGWMQRPR